MDIGALAKTVMTVASPLGMAASGLDMVFKALNIPQPIADIAKLGIGIATGNVLMAVEGGASVVGGLLSQPPQTEYKPSEGAAGKGYAEPFGALTPLLRLVAPLPMLLLDMVQAGPVKRIDTSEPPVDTKTEMRKQEKACRVLLTYFDHIESRGGVPGLVGLRDGQLSRRDLEIVASDSTVTQEVREAAQYMLDNPAFWNRLDTAAGIGPRDGMIGREDLYAMLEYLEPHTRIRPRLPAPPNDPPPVRPPPGHGTPPVDVPPPPPPGRGDGPLDPNLAGYREALRIIDANFATFDAAVGLSDGAFSRENLRAILDNPAASGVLKKAAQFLIDHPEYFNRLEMAASARDGVVTRSDVRGEIDRVDTDTPANPPSLPTPPRSGGEVAPIRSILGDPAMTIEEKIEAILMSMLERSDGELEKITKELANAEDKRNSLSTDTSDKGKKAHADASRSAEVLAQRLQKLMQRRDQMFTLMSNVSKQFHEMAKQAIQNMR